MVSRMARRIQGESVGHKPWVSMASVSASRRSSRYMSSRYFLRVPDGGGDFGTSPSLFPGGGLPVLGSGLGLLCVPTARSLKDRSYRWLRERLPSRSSAPAAGTTRPPRDWPR